jgi:hypothetical protein
MYHLIDGVLY